MMDSLGLKNMKNNDRLLAILIIVNTFSFTPAKGMGEDFQPLSQKWQTFYYREMFKYPGKPDLKRFFGQEKGEQATRASKKMY